MGKKRKVKKRKAFHPFRTFFKVLFSILLAFFLLVGGGCFAYYKVMGELPFMNNGVMKNVTEISILDALLGKDIKLNVAVFGVDKEGTRTDVAFVAHYDSEQESVQLLSIPRDTRVAVCEEVETLLGRELGVVKFNAVHAYGGSEYGAQAAVLQLEDMLGISIDHYVKVNFDALVEIVDAVGGVEVDVPHDMYWDMSDTGDITINLKKGVQVLDGEKALQLVRYRRYTDGDVGRIQVQQLFLKALAEKVLSTENIVKNLGDYIQVIYKHVETDISLTDALKYASYITKLDMNKITMDTLPGVGQYISGISYFIYDPVATRELVDKIFYSVMPEVTETEAVDTKSLLIHVSNGGTITGLATRYTEKLAAEGYRLTTPDTYQGEQVDHTRIQVKQSGIGEDLIPYFKDARIEVAPEQVGDADIRIILGKKES